LAVTRSTCIIGYSTQVATQEDDMTRDDFARWLDDYIAAWRSYDTGAITALFTDDAEYRYHPWDQPLVGAAAIADDWQANRDEPGAWEAEYEPWAIEGHRGVATGTSRYDDTAGKRTYHNVFLVEFADDGRASRFTEVYAQER
jgi:SnoaL-like domain